VGAFIYRAGSLFSLGQKKEGQRQPLTFGFIGAFSVSWFYLATESVA
jgi:hypothetical protein